MNVVVTLVHGTWGRGSLAAHCKRVERPAPWTEKESELVKAIRRALGDAVLIKPFNWSGRNSHRARLQAAEELAKRLTRLVEQYPDAEHAIVAHSHGGNVALYALRKNGLAARMASVVCMATPFVILRWRKWAPASVALLVVVASLFSLAFPIVLFASWYWLSKDPAWVWVPVVPGVTVLIVGFVVRPHRVAKALARRPWRLYRWEARVCRLRERLVIVRAPSDEASLVLAVSALVERLGQVTVGALQRFAVPLVLALIGVVIVVIELGLVVTALFLAASLLGNPRLVGGLTFQEFALPAMLLQLAGVVGAFGLAAALALLMLLAMFVGGAAFGLDAGLPSPWLMSRAEESPSGREQVRRFEKPPGALACRTTLDGLDQ